VLKNVLKIKFFCQLLILASSTPKPAQLVDKILELASTEYDLKKNYDFKNTKIIKEYEREICPRLFAKEPKFNRSYLIS
jgi:hypothetical protein